MCPWRNLYRSGVELLILVCLVTGFQHLKPDSTSIKLQHYQDVKLQIVDFCFF